MKATQAFAVAALLAIGLAVPGDGAARRPKDRTQFDCRETQILRGWDTYSKSPRIQLVKVCPHTAQLKAGQCVTDSAKGMRCLN